MPRPFRSRDSILFRFAESVVNIAHVPKESLGLPPKADIGQLRCRLRCRRLLRQRQVVEKHLAATVHCVDDEIIRRSEQS